MTLARLGTFRPRAALPGILVRVSCPSRSIGSAPLAGWCSPPGRRHSGQSPKTETESCVLRLDWSRGPARPVFRNLGTAFADGRRRVRSPMHPQPALAFRPSQATAMGRGRKWALVAIARSSSGFAQPAPVDFLRKDKVDSRS